MFVGVGGGGGDGGYALDGVFNFLSLGVESGDGADSGANDVESDGGHCDWDNDPFDAEPEGVVG